MIVSDGNKLAIVFEWKAINKCFDFFFLLSLNFMLYLIQYVTYILFIFCAWHLVFRVISSTLDELEIVFVLLELF